MLLRGRHLITKGLWRAERLFEGTFEAVRVKRAQAGCDARLSVLDQLR